MAKHQPPRPVTRVATMLQPLLFAFLALSWISADAFQSAFSPLSSYASRSTSVNPYRTVVPHTLAGKKNDNGDNLDDSSDSAQPRRRWRKLLSSKKAFLTTAAVAAAGASSSLLFGGSDGFIDAAHAASAPVMAIPKNSARDPIADALQNAERRQSQERQAELSAQAARAREIEATQGEAARIQYEQQLQTDQQEAAAQKVRDVETLKRQLLNQGIEPSKDMEGRRQVVLLQKGVNLAKVPGNLFYADAKLVQRNPESPKTYSAQKFHHRRIIKAMVTDMINRGIDPLEYFESHSDKAGILLELPTAQAQQMADAYEANLELYGQIQVPAEGEMSAKEKMAKKGGGNKAAEKAAKKAAKQAKKEQAAREKQAKQEAKKAAAAAAASVSGGASTPPVAAAPAENVEIVQGAEEGSRGFEEEDLTIPDDDGSGDASAAAAYEAAAAAGAAAPTGKKMSMLPKVRLGPATVVVVGGGSLALRVFQGKERAAEEERKRQLKILMGDEDNIRKPLQEISADDDDDGDVMDGQDTNGASAAATDSPSVETPPPEQPAAKESEPAAASAPAPAEPKPKKKKRKGMFGKKRNSREIDLDVLMGSSAKAPALATLLAQILTFGAPGRFPPIGGSMPFETFDLDVAKEKLEEAQQASGLTSEVSAELFANVVNCMLIDIVDLASTSLKEKDTAVTIDAINIMIDFMNHAASLYDSLAEGIVIKPVTYGGTLSKSKLEQMYSTYAVSAMTNMDNISDDFEKRVALLQDVFEINEKKAEGLMMKAVQKNMMTMMKDGEGLEGMQEMLGGMGGGDMDMSSLMGDDADGEGPSPEQLKEMLLTLKQMKDSGSIPPGEMEAVKSQFKEAFGSGINDVIKEADGDGGELNTDDKELLDLMKSILED